MSSEEKEAKLEKTKQEEVKPKKEKDESVELSENDLESIAGGGIDDLLKPLKPN